MFYIAGVDLSVASLMAFYTMAAVLYAGLYGEHSWLPLGPVPYDLWQRRQHRFFVLWTTRRHPH
jgi:ribose/xylose/arabinose/galactoside ABC-type transport system permease subunit